MGKVLMFRAPQPVVGLYPQVFTAEELGELPNWVICGACGFNGESTQFVFNPDFGEFGEYEPLCNCPIAAYLEA